MQTELQLSTEIRDAVRLRCQWSPAHTCGMFQHLHCKQYTYQRRIACSNNTAGKKIGTTMKESINRSPDLVIITLFLKIEVYIVKFVRVFSYSYVFTQQSLAWVLGILM